MRRVGISVILSLAFAGMAAFSVGLLFFIARHYAEQHVRREAGYALLSFARDAARQLDYEVYRHAELLQDYAGLAVRETPVAQQASLDSLRQNQPSYEWLGLIGPDGRLKAQSGKLAADDPILGNLDFYAKVQQIHVSESGPLFSGDAEAHPGLALVIAAPLGRSNGALIARVNSLWSTRVLDESLATVRSVRQMELALFNALGQPIYPQTDLLMRQRIDEMAAPQFIRWSDGQSYLTVAVKSSGYRDYYGLGWLFVARQPEVEVLAFLRQLGWTIFVAALGVVALGGMLGWWLAARISHPLRMLTAATSRLENDENTGIPQVRAYREASLLAHAFARLLASFLQEKKKLRELNASLENQVTERTRLLEQSNESLRATLSERHELIGQLEMLARTDALTGLANRRAFFEQAEAELRRRQRNCTPLALIAIDIDHFKAVNDRYGHEGGDLVLRDFAAACLALLREVDLLARLGGEEFLVLLPDTDLDAAAIVAGRLRVVLAAREVQIESKILRFTVSLGVAQLYEEETLDAWMHRADTALYQAKTQGRNRVNVWREKD